MKAFKRLHESIELFNKAQKTKADSPESLAYRDSMIKRFEFCYEMTWKFFKIYLDKKHSIFVASPKTVFQSLNAIGIVSSEEEKLLIQSSTDRNLTSHTYDQSVDEELSSKIPVYFALFQTIIQRTI